MTSASLLRPRGDHERGRVTMVELFFDLVFVFAVTQLSHGLLADLTTTGALHTLVLFLALWWLWIYTTWIANWLDPERMPVRIMLFVLMLGSLILSASLPHAFVDKGLVFGCVFAAMQIGRTLFVMSVMRGHRPGHYRNFQRVACWLSVSGVFWIAGGLAAGDMRLVLWIVAVAIEYIGPSVYFWVPALGVSTTADWDIDGEHLAERCALFVIIALGESILVTGATFSGLAWDRVHVGAFIVAFLGSVAMWWIYFDTGAVRARRRIVGSSDPGRQGRSVYTYIHLLIIAGIIVCAVADEIVLTHPEDAGRAGVVAILSGPGLYLLGNAAFKWVTNDRRAPPLSHVGGLVLLLILTPLSFADRISALELGAATTAVLIIVATWESMALRRPSRSESARA